MPPFSHCSNTAICYRRNKWSLKSSERKKTLQRSPSAAAWHPVGYCSLPWSPTQGMTQGLSLYHSSKYHRILGVMASNKLDCETIGQKLQSIFQEQGMTESMYTWPWTRCTGPWLVSNLHTKCGSLPIWECIHMHWLCWTKHKTKNWQLFEQNRWNMKGWVRQDWRGEVCILHAEKLCHYDDGLIDT